MIRVILSPTLKLIPNTVSWPNINDFTGRELTHPKTGQTFYSAIIEASRHLVDIAEEDWNMVAVLTFKEIKPETVYPINAEFEVFDQLKTVSGNWVDCYGGLRPDIEQENPVLEYRQIARLVKPKEYKSDKKLKMTKNTPTGLVQSQNFDDLIEFHERGFSRAAILENFRIERI